MRFNSSSMNNSKTVLVLLVFSSLIISCKSKVAYQEGAYIEPYLRDSIPYTLAQHEEISDKILLFLPPVLDEVEFEKSKVYRFFYDQGYDILSVYKAPAQGAYYYSRKAMDFKDQNVQNVQNLILELKRKKRIKKDSRIHILAMEQGVYMAPSLANTFYVDTVFLINGTPFSTYFSLSRIADGDLNWNQTRQDFIKDHFAVDSLSDFKAKLAAVESSGSDVYSLGDYTNMYWLSYHANYYIDEYSQMPSYACWLYFEDYPLYKETDFLYQKLLDQTRPQAKGKHYKLEGLGRFKDEQDWEKVMEGLEAFFKL